jgi:ATP-binding cassette subfamily B protein/subfamily B ATP-binding cassette protein MsbA
MLPTRDSSKSRFRAYLERRRTKNAAATDASARDAHAQHAPTSDKPGAKPPAKPTTKPSARSRGFFDLLRAFWRQCQGHQRAIVLALTTNTITTALSLAMPLATKIAVDYALTDAPGPAGLPAWAISTLALPNPASDAGAARVALLWWLGVAMVLVASLGVLVGSLGRWQMTRVTKRVQVELRRKAFEHAVRLPLHRVQAYKSGGMSSLLREDAGVAGELGFSVFYNPWRAIVQLVGTLAILSITDWRMLLGGLLLAPAVWVTHKTWIARIRPLYSDAKRARQGIDASTTEAFGGLRVVRGFGRSRTESSRFVLGQHYMTRIEVRTWWWSRIVEIAWAIMIPIATSAVLIYGGSQVVRGSLTIGDLMMFSTYLLMLLGPLETLTSTATNVQNNLAAFDRVLNLLGEGEEFGGKVSGVALDKPRVAGAIALRDVRFAYPVVSPSKDGPDGRDVGREPHREPGRDAPPDGGDTRAAHAPARPNANGHHALTSTHTPQPPPREVIRAVTLDVAPGEVIAFVGRSGAGKTTLCNLIARFYDPTGGSITLDGIDLREVDLASYRALLGIVEQDVFLFDGSIAENIAYASKDATPQRIIAAATSAHAHDFISQLEKGYETLIGERGVRLSGGQKQRIAIARAILADPRILILDEATSNLDTESERLIQASLSRLMQGRTCFVIAHRLSTVRIADRIVVLEQGRVEEVGTHDQLLSLGGMYATLLRMQVEGHDPDTMREASGAHA